MIGLTILQMIINYVARLNSILHGYDIVDNIADLLEVKIRSDQKSLLDEYREKFFEVDY